MASAIHANSAFYKTKDGPSVRDEMIAEINRRSDDLIAQVYGAKSADEVEREMIERDPFYAAIRDIEVDQVTDGHEPEEGGDED